MTWPAWRIDNYRKTVEFQERLAEGETLDDLLPEAFCGCAGSR